MRHWLISIWLLLIAAGGVSAQSITITGTVTDPSGNAYQGGSGRVQLIPTNVGWTTNNGYPVNQTVWTITTLDGFGRFSIQLPSTLSYDQQVANPQYQFSFTSATCPGGSQTANFTMTGLSLSTSQDISTAIHSQAAPLPTCGGTGGGALNVNGVAVPPTPNLQNSSTVTFGVSGSNIQATATPAISVNGTSVPGANFVDNSSVTFSQSLGQVTANAISSIFNGGTVTNPTTFLSSIFNCGPNPWIDITCYGARPVSSVSQTTATSNGTTAITVASATGFQAGDGISIQGIGANNSLATPAAPTVTAVLAKAGMNTGIVVAGLTGSTTSQYCLVGRDIGQGLTACSPTGTLTTGAATLGTITTNITSMSRSGNVVTVTTASASGVTVGSEVYITGSTSPTFSGTYQVASVIDADDYTYIGGIDTRNQVNGVTSATGGTMESYQANHLVIPQLAYQYYIYKYNGTNFAFYGIARPGEPSWDDFGATPPARPWFVPATAPASATADTLSTTIVGVVGNVITLANSATQSLSGQIAIHDDGPAMVAAVNAATHSPKSATVHIPTAVTGQAYVVNSYTVLGTNPYTLFQQNPIICNDTITTPGSMTWTANLGGGSPSGSGGFSWQGAQQIEVGTAFPCIAANSTSANFNYLAWVALNDNGLMMTIGAPGSGGGGGFNLTVSNSSFSRAGSTDTVGMAIVGYGSTQQHFNYTLFSINDSSAYGAIVTPMVYYRNDIASLNGSGNFNCESCFWVGRGYLVDSSLPSGLLGSFNFYTAHNNYAQQTRMPVFNFGALNGPAVLVDTMKLDTVGISLIANLGANQLSGTIINVPDLGAEANGIPGLVSGSPLTGLTYSGSATQIGQNVNLSRFRTDVSVAGLGTTPASQSLQTFDTMVSVGTGYGVISPLPAPSGVATTVGGGGSVPPGTWLYQVTSFDPLGRSTVLSSSTGTCTSVGSPTFTQTCTTTWSSVPGAINYSVYRTISTGGGANGIVACQHTTTLSCTDSASSAGGGSPPVAGTAGAVSITAQGITVPGTFNAAQFVGADFTQKINACAVASGLYGWFCDARPFAGVQSGSSALVFGTPVGAPGAVLLPTYCRWTITINGGTQAIVNEYPRFAILGDSVQNNCVIKNTSGVNGAYAGFWTVPEGLSGGDYYYAGGFQTSNSTGNTFKSGSECLINSGQDGTYLYNGLCINNSSTQNPLFGNQPDSVLTIISTATNEKTCCKAILDRWNANGNSVSGNVLQILSNNTGGGVHGFSIINGSYTHPGAGFHNIFCQDTQTNPSTIVDFGSGTYEEDGTSGDTTTSSNTVDGCATVDFGLLNEAAGLGSQSKPMLTITNRANSAVRIKVAPGSSGSGNWATPFTCIINQFTGTNITCPSSYFGTFYDSTNQNYESGTFNGSIYLPASTSGENMAIGTTNGACGTNLLCIGAILINSIGGALFPGQLKFGTNITANTAGSHFNTTGASNDIVGTIVITNPATSGSATFSTPYNNAPICGYWNTADPTGTVGFAWISTSTTQVTINVHTAPASTSTYFYACWGHPN